MTAPLKLLFLGDIVGRSGRRAVAEHLPVVRQRLAPDVIVINAENAAGGFGLTRTIAEELFALGADVITTGNHVWDQKEILNWIADEPRVLRPLNLPAGAPGQGHIVVTTAQGHKVLVISPMGRLFMETIDCPFAAVDAIVQAHPLGSAVQATMIDFHAEATSEKQAMGHYVDGRASLVVGTHTHTPSADTQILPGGTAYQTDAGMCGDYGGVIGFTPASPIARFTRKLPTERLSPMEGEATMCGVFVTINPTTGHALSLQPVRCGGRLIQTLP